MTIIIVKMVKAPLLCKIYRCHKPGRISMAAIYRTRDGLHSRLWDDTSK